MAASGHFGTPLTRIVAPYGASPRAPAAGFARRPRPFRHTPYEDRSWPHRELHEGSSGRVCMAASGNFG
eukprot:9112373-Pyramimonas_sp.AAC.1